MTTPGPSAAYEVTTIDVEYLRHGDEPLLVRVYQPQGPGPFPALLEVHGGQWSGGARDMDETLNRAIAAGGIVVAAIDFRLAPAHRYPAQVQDIHYGIRWLKANAARFNADPTTVGGLGTSSGGHGIVLTAMRTLDPRYAALPLSCAPEVDATLRYVISCWGIVDPWARTEFARTTPRAGEGFGGAERLQHSWEGYFGDEATMLEGSPQGIFDRGEPATLPPLLVVQGDQDFNIPYTIPQRFAECWQQADGHAQCELFAGMPHGFGRRPGPETDRAVATIQQFIARCLP